MFRSTGELTRGMLVVDRRIDEGAYVPGANRAMVHAEQSEREKSDIPIGKYAVDIEHRDQSGDPEAGVLCVTETPGKEALLDLLLRRVWGVE
jgi:hypothetical protein